MSHHEDCAKVWYSIHGHVWNERTTSKSPSSMHIHFRILLVGISNRPIVRRVRATVRTLASRKNADPHRELTLSHNPLPLTATEMMSYEKKMKKIQTISRCQCTYFKEENTVVESLHERAGYGRYVVCLEIKGNQPTKSSRGPVALPYNEYRVKSFSFLAALQGPFIICEIH